MAAARQFDANDVSDWSFGAKRRRWPAIGVVVAIHLALLLTLLQFHAVRDTTAQSAPMRVTLLASQPAAPAAAIPPPQLEIPEALTRLTIHERPVAVVQPLPSMLPEATPAIRAAAASEPASVTPPTFNAAYLDNPAPDYPPVSRHLGESGRVLMRVLVNAEGHAQQVEVERSSGFERLDRAATDVIWRWRFVAAKQSGENVAAWVQFPIYFDLSQS